MNHFLTLELHLPYKRVLYSAHVGIHRTAAVMIQGQGSGAIATTQLCFSVPGKISSRFECCKTIYFNFNVF